MPPMPFVEAQEFAEKHGIPVPNFSVATTERGLKRVLNDFSWPVAMKISSSDILHKSDVGGVVLDIESEEEALETFRSFQEIAEEEDAEFGGAVVQQQVDGKYVLIGLKRDPQFGPVVAFGLGGIFVEILEDVTFRVCPVSDRDIGEMMKEIRGYPILAGARGEEPVDLDAIKDTIRNVSDIGMEEDGVREMDINPLVVSPEGAWAVDVRVIRD